MVTKIIENVGLWMFLLGGCALVNGSPLIPSIIATVGLVMIYSANRKETNGIQN